MGERERLSKRFRCNLCEGTGRAKDGAGWGGGDCERCHGSGVVVGPPGTNPKVIADGDQRVERPAGDRITVIEIAYLAELEARAERGEYADALRKSMEQARDWMREQQRHCRPPDYADLPAGELDAIRGPSAAYGAVVYDLCAGKLDVALNRFGETTSASTGKDD